MRKLYTLAIGIFFCFNMSGGDKTSPQINVGSTPDGKILMEASVAGTGKDEPEQLNNLAKGNFEWKALWARPIKTHKEADDLISLTKTMKCNVLIIYTEGRGKAEALTALIKAGYENVFMFGDSVEDSRASYAAMKETPDGVNLIFVPVIPGLEEYCFEQGLTLIHKAIAGDVMGARTIAAAVEEKFRNNMAGSKWKVD